MKRWFAVCGAAVALCALLGVAAFAAVPSTSSSSAASPTAASVDKVTWASGAGTHSASEFGAWRNRPVAVWDTWNDAHTWNNMRQLWTLSYFESTPRYPGRMSFGQPLLDDSSNYASCNTGAYDDHYRYIATQLAQRGFGNAYIRLGWEANGDWYAWKMGTDYAGFKNCFARASRIFKAASPSFQIEYGVAATWTGSKADLGYPGDDVVDLIGADFYDGWPVAATPSDFDAKCNQTNGSTPVGLCAFATFARSHAKKLSVPEWGIRNQPAPGGGGDNPVFVQKMFQFFQQNSDILAYEAYFDLQGSTFEISHGQNPLSAQMYLALFGGTPPAAVPTTTVPPVTTVKPTTTVPVTTVKPTTTVPPTTTVKPTTTVPVAPAAPVTTAPTTTAPAPANARQVTWLSGASAASPTAFATYRNRPLGVVGTSSTGTTWAAMKTMAASTRASTTAASSTAGTPRLSFDQPLLDSTSTLKACRSGTYDANYRAIAQQLLANGNGNAFIRLGADPNAAGSAIGTDYTGYKSCFVRAAKLFKTVSRNFAIEWDATAASTARSAALYYPGDASVDAVGADVTDAAPAATTAAAFTAKCNAGSATAPVGMCQFLAFAKAHKKSLAVPEWSIANTTGGGGDDPVFVQQMYDFFVAHRASIAYESYGDTGTAATSLTTANPKASAMYKSLWSS